MTLSRLRDKVPALIVNQWLEEWNEIDWDPARHQSKPPEYFYMFTLSANELRALSEVYRRKSDPSSASSLDLSAQRYHDRKRSEEIGRYVKYGFPWSDLSEAKRRSGEFSTLRKPGWLPTAIVVNILRPGDERDGRIVRNDAAIEIANNHSMATLSLPDLPLPTGSPPPIEVIDGQHRLLAFTDDSSGDFQLPVIAFHGLDRSWQAYLFWTINIKPKRINASLAFDLYPLLRNEDWLDKFYGHSIYRDVRAQELVHIIHSHDRSPWRNRINMLGEPHQGRKLVSQAAWIRSLTASMVKQWDPDSPRIGGLYGAPPSEDNTVLPWPLAQQAAFLIFLWQHMAESVASTEAIWARTLREQASQDSQPTSDSRNPDAAFSGEFTLLNTDQGVRGFLQVANDLFFISSAELGLLEWSSSPPSSEEGDLVNSYIRSAIEIEQIESFTGELCSALAEFDWRSSSFPGAEFSIDQQRRQAAYRGSGGYAMLKADLLRHLEHLDQPFSQRIQSCATEIIDLLGIARATD